MRLDLGQLAMTILLNINLGERTAQL